jgi:hypothetical protein
MNRRRSALVDTKISLGFAGQSATDTKVLSMMRNKPVSMFAIAVVALTVLNGVAILPQQDRDALKVPDGLAFSDFKGYDAWQTIAVSETEGSVKAILGNQTMIAAYRQGVPENGKPFPEGSKTAKIEWIKKKNPEAPYFVEVPDILKSLSFIEKDSKRFPNTHGWAYAQFDYDAGSKTFKPSVTGSECGFACHSKVASRDYIYTAYPLR